MVMHEATKCEYVKPMKWQELTRAAKQIPRAVTNPATFTASGIPAQIELMKGENYD